ncbi:uncharacterized protein [Rutidosis leptorrhynchoides]|uniref:uncharacterized protein n=1 Tax=Rutidosis leptorrhynchoides TaxID=125765 RepID=UPI003A99F96E
MGFGSKWRDWILACLKSTSISILVNGSPTKEFNISWGVRQGDPLSPFLFILAAEGLNILAKAATEKGLFKGVEIGVDKIIVSHLQYAYDTIFIGDWNRDNVYSIHNLLKCFELASGLKVDFHKSSLFGIGASLEEVGHVATILGCQIGKLPFVYLGLPIDSKMNSIKSWDPVIEKIKARLLDWKMRMIIHGANGGLGVGNDKCCSSFSGTRHNIISAGNAIQDLHVDFKNSFVKKIGDGSTTSFWNEQWVGDTKLSTLFPRLYRLESLKEAVISDRISFANTGPTFNWAWSRQPSGRSLNELDCLVDLIAGVPFDRDKADSWVWTLASNQQFTIKRLTNFVDEQLLQQAEQQHETIRNNLVPRKIEIFVWRVRKKRIPVRVELDKRSVVTRIFHVYIY